MTQAPVLSSSGMFSKFYNTQVIRVADLDSGNILQAFRNLRYGQVFHLLPIVVVDLVGQQNGNRVRQMNILRAVLLSGYAYEQAKTANPSVTPFIAEQYVADDYLLADDRFNRTLSAIAPLQERQQQQVLVGAGGDVNIGVPFVDVTLYSSVAPTSTDGTAGTAVFPLSSVGNYLNLSYVIQPSYPTLLVTRQEEQTVKPELVIQNRTSAVVLNPILAGLLGLTLPSY